MGKNIVRRNFEFSAYHFFISSIAVSVCLLILYSLKLAEENNHRAGIKTLRHNVRVVQKTIEAYIFRACHNNHYVTPNMDQLLDSGLIYSSGQTLNPINDTRLSFTINWAKPIKYSVIAKMGSSDQARSLYRLSGATRYHSDNLIWDKIIKASDAEIEGGREFRAAFEGDCK